MAHAAIMLCAGRATRMQGAVADKVLAPLAGRPVLAYSIAAFLEAGVAEQFIFVVRDAHQRAAIARLFGEVAGKRARAGFVRGGAERQDSVYNGVRKLGEKVECVFIHDCARPLIAPAALRTLLAAVQKDQAAVLAHRVTDTIKQVPVGKKLERQKLRDLRRETLWAMETPQAFARALILKAYQNVRAKKLRVTDDVGAVTALGHRVTIVENSSPNPKLTHPADYAWVKLLLEQAKA